MRRSRCPRAREPPGLPAGGSCLQAADATTHPGRRDSAVGGRGEARDGAGADAAYGHHGDTRQLIVLPPTAG